MRAFGFRAAGVGWLRALEFIGAQGCVYWVWAFRASKCRFISAVEALGKGNAAGRPSARRPSTDFGTLSVQVLQEGAEKSLARVVFPYSA